MREGSGLVLHVDFLSMIDTVARGIVLVHTSRWDFAGVLCFHMNAFVDDRRRLFAAVSHLRP